jgi:DNA-binding transcriptional ArsR family regulator
MAGDSVLDLMTTPRADVRPSSTAEISEAERSTAAEGSAGPGLSDAIKALADPMRWDIVNRLARVDELPCAMLWQTLPISKPTISHHIKVLSEAGLLKVRKDGRQFFYSLRRDVAAGVVRDIQAALTAPSTAARPY